MLTTSRLLTGQNPSNPVSNSSACLVGPYAPPLPTDITIDSKHYARLTTDDVDCTETKWKKEDACTYDFCQGQNAAESKAATAMSIPYIISAVASPFLGYGVDRFGGRAIIAVICPCILISAHLGLGFATGLGPVLPLVGQGIAYSVFAATLWPSIPFTVPQRAEGLAYGFVTAIQNGGLALFPIIVSIVYDGSGRRYIPSVELIFVGFAIVGLFMGLCLNVYDASHGHVLNRSHLNNVSYNPRSAQHCRPPLQHPYAAAAQPLRSERPSKLTPKPTHPTLTSSNCGVDALPSGAFPSRAAEFASSHPSPTLPITFPLHPITVFPYSPPHPCSSRPQATVAPQPEEGSAPPADSTEPLPI